MYPFAGALPRNLMCADCRIIIIIIIMHWHMVFPSQLNNSGKMFSTHTFVKTAAPFRSQGEAGPSHAPRCFENSESEPESWLRLVTASGVAVLYFSLVSPRSALPLLPCTLNKGALVLRPTSRLRAASGPAN